MKFLERLFGSWDNMIEAAFVLILVYLVLSRASGFSEIIKSTSSGLTSGFKVLQGR